VVVAARTRAGCAAVVDEIESGGGRAWALELDVARPDSIRAAVARARELTADVGPLGWLVNNAGIAESAPLLPREGATDEADALVRRHLEVNFHGARLMTEALLGDMLARDYGRIVNVASSAGLRGYAYASAYCASKFALVGYTLAAAHELERTGVKLNAVCPHYVDSPMLDASIAKLVAKTGRSAEETRAFFREQNPGGELITVDQVADAVALLLTGDQTATLLELDGSPNHALWTPNTPPLLVDESDEAFERDLGEEE